MATLVLREPLISILALPALPAAACGCAAMLCFALGLRGLCRLGSQRGDGVRIALSALPPLTRSSMLPGLVPLLTLRLG